VTISLVALHERDYRGCEIVCRGRESGESACRGRESHCRGLRLVERACRARESDCRGRKGAFRGRESDY